MKRKPLARLVVKNEEVVNYFISKAAVAQTLQLGCEYAHVHSNLASPMAMDAWWAACLSLTRSVTRSWAVPNL